MKKDVLPDCPYLHQMMRELTLTFTNCNTQESELCISPGQHSRAEPVGGEVGELPKNMSHERGRSDPAPQPPYDAVDMGGMPPPPVACGRSGTEIIRVRAVPAPQQQQHSGKWSLRLAWTTQ